ncbi:MAG: class I SAM-dependent methyltransferase [Bryobacterales bacterium]|nr:class I SAM-dependent methyltransferase [Bryobacterales bacterium]
MISGEEVSGLGSVLGQLYGQHLERNPEDAYIRQHGAPGFLAGTLRVFRFYEPYLPAGGRLLDWGCRHAPDACLIHTARPGLAIDGCDVFGGERFEAFYRYAGLSYQQLCHFIELPYAGASFDVVIASGVLEHVPMDYESLKEVHRVLRPAGRLIITYLPNRTSLEEWQRRRRAAEYHQRLYTLEQLKELLLHTGFSPLVAGYQTRLDLLGEPGVPRRLLRWTGMRRFTSCLCAVAARSEYL